MFESLDHRPTEPCLPSWLADDIGVPRTTRLRDMRPSSVGAWRRKLTRTFGQSQIDEAIANVPLFEGLTKNEFRLASRLSTAIEVPAGTVLAHEGAIGNEFLIVLEGHVHVLHGEQVIATRGPGSPLGEIALLGNRPRTATLVAKTRVRAQVASKKEFDGLLAAVPMISERLRSTMAERLAA